MRRGRYRDVRGNRERRKGSGIFRWIMETILIAAAARIIRRVMRRS
jgi:hypothetical protein